MATSTARAMATTLGADSRSKVGRMGPCRIRSMLVALVIVGCRVRLSGRGRTRAVGAPCRPSQPASYGALLNCVGRDRGSPASPRHLDMDRPEAPPLPSADRLLARYRIRC